MSDLRIAVVGEDKASGELKKARDSIKTLGEAAKDFVALDDKFKGFTITAGDVAGALKAMGQAFIGFAKESIQAAQEQERADRQLALAAKDLTSAFKDQASAFQQQLGVQDDMVQEIQAMLLQFGEAPSEVEATTRAILDFSAATGQDAVSAARQLASGVESGRGAFKEYGIQVHMSGKASHDMVAATKALRDKFGGAAADASQSFEGQVRGLSASFGELQETFGGFLSAAIGGSGILSTLKKSLDGLSVAVATIKSLMGDAGILNDLASGNITPSSLNSMLFKARDSIISQARGGGVADLPGVVKDRKTKYGLGLKDEHVDPRYSKADLHDTEHDNRELEAGEQAYKEKLAAKEREWLKDVSAESTHRLIMEQEQTQAAANKKRLSEQEKMYDDLVKIEREGVDRVMKEQQAWANVGSQLGSAFVGAFTEQLSSLSQGGEFDVADFFADLLPLVLGAIGSLYGPGGQALGSAVGSLGAVGIRALNADGKKKGGTKRHFGGWIDAAAPRFHGGGWVGGDERPITALTGERVLSRDEVSRMGGQLGVDAAARGGGGRGAVTVNVSSFDSRSTAEFFIDRGARGLNDALKTGQGSLARLLKGRLL